MNLVITCARHLEPETMDELRKNLLLFGDQSPEIEKTSMSGILIAKTNLDPFNFVRKIKEKISEEPWTIRYCLRIIPIQQVVATSLEEILECVPSLMNKVNETDTYRITIEKRNSIISSSQIISKIAENITNKVSLEEPDWIILVEILADNTGLSVLRKEDIFSLEISKRKLLE